MPGAEATTTSGADELINSLNPENVASLGDSELKNEWKKLTKETEGSVYETDIEARHSDTNFKGAMKLTFAHPDSISVSTKPVSRRHDMTAHVRDHFDSLLNNAENGNRLKTGRPDTERLLKICELVYLYDAVYRFSPETIVDPDIDGLERLRFVALPATAHAWMGEVDVLWWTLHNELAPEEPVNELIDRLYESRDEFVEDTKAAEIFLPIRSDYTDDVEDKRRKIAKRLERNSHVKPKLVHDYCFSRTVDSY